MNANTVILQINGTIDWIKALQATAQQIPQQHRRKLVGIDHADDLLRRLELAREEVQTYVRDNALPAPRERNIEPDGNVLWA